MDKKIFGTLFFSIFAAVTGVGIVVPLLPVYAHDLGAGGLYIGLIFGSFSLSRTVFLPYFGRQSDRKGRKPYIVVGLLSYAIISIAFMAFKSVEALIVVRFIQGIASAMILPVTQAYVGDITPEGREGFSMGLFNMSVFCGLSIGPLVGGFINTHLGLNVAFGCMGLLALFGSLLSQCLLPSVSQEKIMNCVRELPDWSRLLRDREMAGLFIFRMAYTLCIGIIWAFMPIFADEAFSLSSASIGFLVMLAVFTSGLIHTPMGMLADRLDKKKMVVCGGLIAALAIFSFERADGFGDLFRANILFGIGGGIAMPALMALAVVKGNETGTMGSIMSLITVAHSLGMLIGSIFGGMAMDYFQLRRAFSTGAGLMVLGAMVFYFCMAKRYD